MDMSGMQNTLDMLLQAIDESVTEKAVESPQEVKPYNETRRDAVRMLFPAIRKLLPTMDAKDTKELFMVSMGLAAAIGFAASLLHEKDGKGGSNKLKNYFIEAMHKEIRDAEKRGSDMLVALEGALDTPMC